MTLTALKTLVWSRLTAQHWPLKAREKVMAELAECRSYDTAEKVARKYIKLEQERDRA